MTAQRRNRDGWLGPVEFGRLASKFMKMDTRIFPDSDALSRAALDELLRIVSDAVQERGRFAIALAGGHTPAKLYQTWGQPEKGGMRTPWEHVHLFWGDERYVAHDDPASNYRMARESLIAHVPIPAKNVHPMPTDAPQPEKAAETYEAELRRFFGPGRLHSTCNCLAWAWRAIPLLFFPDHRRSRRRNGGQRRWWRRLSRRSG